MKTLNITIAFDRSSHRTGFISEIFFERHSSSNYQIAFCNCTDTSIVLPQIYCDCHDYRLQFFQEDH